MKKFFFLFLLILSNVTFAASDVIVDAVTCKTFEGKDLKLIFVPESQFFSLSLDNAVVVETTIDNIYLQPYAQYIFLLNPVIIVGFWSGKMLRIKQAIPTFLWIFVKIRVEN